MLYLDTSVLVAYYCPEALSQQVQSLLSEAVKPALSYLTEVELFSAVAKKVRSEEIRSADGNRILAKFSSHVDADFYTIIAVVKHHWRLAKGWIGLFSTSLRTLDALHLSIASAEELELVTADKLLYQAAEILGVRAHLIGE
jgi:predicted nucleic acid-binding protein